MNCVNSLNWTKCGKAIFIFFLMVEAVLKLQSIGVNFNFSDAHPCTNNARALVYVCVHVNKLLVLPHLSGLPLLLPLLYPLLLPLPPTCPSPSPPPPSFFLLSYFSFFASFSSSLFSLFLLNVLPLLLLPLLLLLPFLLFILLLLLLIPLPLLLLPRFLHQSADTDPSGMYQYPPMPM